MNITKMYFKKIENGVKASYFKKEKNWKTDTSLYDDYKCKFCWFGKMKEEIRFSKKDSSYHYNLHAQCIHYKNSISDF